MESQNRGKKEREMMRDGGPTGKSHLKDLNREVGNHEETFELHGRRRKEVNGEAILKLNGGIRRNGLGIE